MLGHAVQEKALFAGDDTALHVVGPRADLEQSAFGAGVESLTGGLVERREAVLPEKNQAVATVQGLAHNLLLARSDGCADEDATGLAESQPLLAVAFELLVGVGTMDDDGGLVGDVEEEAVADNLAVHIHQPDMMKDGEEFGVEALDEQAAGVVVEVALPVVELTVAEEDFVAVAFLEEDGATDGDSPRRRTAGHRGKRRTDGHGGKWRTAGHGGKWRTDGRSGGGRRSGGGNRSGEGGRTGGERRSGGGRRSGGRSPGALRLSAGNVGVLKGPPSAGAAALETTHYVPKVPPFGQRGFHTDNEMEMVGHDAELPDLDHRVILGNLLLLNIADSLAQAGQLHHRRFRCTAQPPKQREPIFDHQCQHISPHVMIVVRRQPTVHRMLHVVDVHSGGNGLIPAFAFHSSL